MIKFKRINTSSPSDFLHYIYKSTTQLHFDRQDSSSQPSMAANSDEVLLDLFPLLRQYRDGRVERFMGNDFVPPSMDPETGVQSKDIDISPDINLSARLYLPKSATPPKKLPLLLYFHGGGFVMHSAFSSVYQNHLNLLVAEAHVVAVSVNYRLAPENPLPAAYEDAWTTLKWISSDAAGEEGWIKEFADLTHVYLAGASAGANIAHQVAIRAGIEKPYGIHLSGVYLDCPFFGGNDLVPNEETHEVFPRSFTDKLWLCAYPSIKDFDDPWINPAMDLKLSSFGCKRLLVCVAEDDVFRERGLRYKEALCKSGWCGDLEIVDVAGEGHVFTLLSPTSVNAMAMIKRVASFINQYSGP